MKTILLILNKLQGHFMENKLISTVYIISFIVSVLSFTFIYNNFVPIVVRLAEDDPFDHYYSFRFSEEIQNFSWLRSFLEKYDTYYVEYLNFKESLATDEERPIMAFQNDVIIDTLVEGRLEFTEEEKKGDSYVAILPAHSGLGVLPDTYTYKGNTYKAIGWGLNSSIIIPEKLFIRQKIGITGLEIYLNGALTAEEHRELIQSICAKYPVDSVSSADSMNELYDSNTKQIIFILALGFLVMVFVFSYLIKYLLLAGKAEHIIYRLVGARNGEITAVIALESLISNMFLSILAVCIHAALFDNVFDKLNYYDAVKLGARDYIFIVGITMVSSFIAVLPHIIQSIRITFIAGKNQI